MKVKEAYAEEFEIREQEIADFDFNKWQWERDLAEHEYWLACANSTGMYD